MGAPIPTQYDLNAGFDLASVAAPTRTQLIQAINQLGPLTNIGGIICFDGGGGNSWPGVTLNPRFKRYIWLDLNGGSIPAIKLYDQSGADTYANWTANSIPVGSITNASINAAAAIAISKLAFGTARYVVRTNAAGNAVEYVAPTGILNDGELPASRIQPGGSDGYLKTSAGVSVWVANATERAAIAAGLNNVAPGVLVPGAPNTILGTNGAGVVIFDSLNNLLLAKAINLTLLAQGGAAIGDVLSWNGSSWVKTTPVVSILSTAPISTVGVVSANDLGTTVHTFPHGLGALPKMVRGVLQCITVGDGTFAVGDEVNIESLSDPNGDAESAASVTADAVNISIGFETAGAARTIPAKAGGSRITITNARWKPKVYAWL